MSTTSPTSSIRRARPANRRASRSPTAIWSTSSTWHCEAFTLVRPTAHRCWRAPRSMPRCGSCGRRSRAGASLHIPDVVTAASADGIARLDGDPRHHHLLRPHTTGGSACCRWSGHPDVALRYCSPAATSSTGAPAAGTPFTVVNNYGVTEATVVSTSGPVAPDRCRRSARPEHRPGDRRHIVCTSSTRTATGARRATPGSSTSAGRGVAIGYINRPRGDRRTVRPGSVGGPGARMYRTGDLVRVRARRRGEFLGRLDNQVQIRGHRVELDEIATVLTRTRRSTSARRRPRRGAGRTPHRRIRGLVATAERSARGAACVPLGPSARVHGADRVRDIGSAPPHAEREAGPRARTPGTESRHDARRGRSDARVEAAVVGMLEELLDIDGCARTTTSSSSAATRSMGAQLVARVHDRFDVELTLLTIFDNPTAGRHCSVYRAGAGARSMTGHRSPGADRARASHRGPTAARALSAPRSRSCTRTRIPCTTGFGARTRCTGTRSCHAWVVTRYDGRDARPPQLLGRADARHRAARRPRPGMRSARSRRSWSAKCCTWTPRSTPESACSRPRGSRAVAWKLLRAHIADIVDELLEAVQHRHAMDVVADFAVPLPAIVSCEMLGLPTEDWPQLTGWTSAFAVLLGNFQHNPVRADRCAQTVDDMTAYFRQRSTHADAAATGCCTRSTTAEVDGDRFTEEEVIANTILTMVGGLETTTNLIANGLLAVLATADQGQLLRQSRHSRSSAVEEFLRFESPIQHTARLAPEDDELGDQTHPQAASGDRRAWLPANRDPARFHDPDRLDIRRPEVATSRSAGPDTTASARRWRGSWHKLRFPAIIDRVPNVRLARDEVTWREGVGHSVASSHCRRVLADRKDRETSKIRHRRMHGDVELSYAQQRLWLLDQLEPAPWAYNVSVVRRLGGALHTGAPQRGGSTPSSSATNRSGPRSRRWTSDPCRRSVRPIRAS